MSVSQDLLSFSCPNCKVQLRVPASMAGIEGPCPSCAAIIHAPELPARSPSSFSPDAQTPQVSPSQAASASAYADPPKSQAEPRESEPPRDSTPTSPPADQHSLRKQIGSGRSAASPRFPKDRSNSERADCAPQTHFPVGNEPTSEGVVYLDDHHQQNSALNPSPESADTEESKIAASSAKNVPSKHQDPEPDPLVALKPTPITDPGRNGRDRLPTSSSLPSERKSRKEPDLPASPDQLSSPDGDPSDLDSSKSMEPANPSSSSALPSTTEIPEGPLSRKSRLIRSDLESKETVKLNVNASTVGALVSHEHAGRFENSRRSSPTWPGVSVLLLFLTLSAVMTYLVLDLTDMLPHSKGSGQLPDPAAGESSKSLPIAAANSAPAEESGTHHGEEHPASEQVSGVFKVDPNQLFPESSPANQSVQPDPKAPVDADAQGLISEEPLVVSEDLEAGSALASGESPDAAPRGALIDEQDVKVSGEVSLPPLIDLNPSRNSLPQQSDRPSAPAETLSLFLTARSLGERRPYMSASRRSEAELERGPLAKELPPTINVKLLKYLKDHSESTNETFFEVFFQRESSAPILVQVDVTSNGRIQIHTDAFLDLYNDEMARFQAVPVKGDRTFHTLADAYKQCFEEKIPGAKDKSYLKLRQHEQVAPRLQAYFAKDSTITQQIEQSKALLWGRSGICTVTVRWNTDYGRPFVELVSIDDLSWGP